MTPTPTPLLRLAVRADLLPGDTFADQLAYAERLDVQGVELLADDVVGRVDEITGALTASPVRVSSVHLGWDGGLLDPDERARRRALDRLHAALTMAADLGAAGVTVVPHRGPLALPNLMPYKASIEVAVELMVTHLSTVSDFAFVFERDLYLLPLNRYETGFLNHLGQARALRRRLKDHTRVRLAADTFHLSQTEADPAAALHEAAPHLGVVYLTDSNGGLPGAGSTVFGPLLNALRGGGFDGWLVLAQAPGAPATHDLAGAVAAVRTAGE